MRRTILAIALALALPATARPDDAKSAVPQAEREVPPPGGSRRLDPIPAPGESGAVPSGRPASRLPTSRGIFGAHESPPTPSSAIIDEQRRSETPPERQWQFDAPYQINAGVR